MGRIYLNDQSKFENTTAPGGRDIPGNRTVGFTSHTPMNSDGSLASYSLESRVKQSDAYINAYNIFSSDSRYGGPYLARLEQIPSIAIEAPDTWFDYWNLSNKADNKDFATYQMCIEQINLLVSEYFQFLNSLPATQIEQQLGAGIYGILSGDSVTNSEMDVQQGKISSADMEVTEPIDIISSVGQLAFDFLTGGVSTITNAWQSVQNVRNAAAQLDLSEQSLSLSKDQYELDKQKFKFTEESFLANLWTNLDKSGYNMPSTKFESFDEFYAWTEAQAIHDPHAAGKRATDERNATIAGIYNASLDPFRKRDALALSDFGGDFNQFYLDVGNFQINQAYNLLKYQSKKAKFDADVQSKLSADDFANSEIASWKSKLFESRFTKLMNENKISFFNEQLDKAKKSKDPLAKFAITQMLFNDPLLSKVSTASQVSTPLMSAMQQSAYRVNDPNNASFYSDDF